MRAPEVWRCLARQVCAGSPQCSPGVVPSGQGVSGNAALVRCLCSPGNCASLSSGRAQPQGWAAPTRTPVLVQVLPRQLMGIAKGRSELQSGQDRSGTIQEPSRTVWNALSSSLEPVYQQSTCLALQVHSVAWC